MTSSSEDIRAYRERNLAHTGFSPIFPLWGADTSALAEEMLAAGLKAVVTAVSPTSKLDRSFAGRWFDRSFLNDLPEGTDPLGENGEFHTCVLDGPMFPTPINARPGQIISRQVPASHDSTGPTVTAWYADIDLL